MRVRHLAALTAVLALALGGLAPTAGATHRAWQNGWSDMNYWSAYQVNVSYGYRYNHHRVELRWVDCRVPWSLGYDVTFTWCGAWNNGGEYMDVGANWRAKISYGGLTFSFDRWIRERVNKYGQVYWERYG